MITVNDYIKNKYGTKMYKICFSAGMSCPNRDGLIDNKGCIFCSAGGSGEYSVDITECINAAFIDEDALNEKINAAKDKVKNKFKGDKYIAYFQAFTNTYAPVDYLKKVFMSVINHKDIAILSIGTRPDCISDDVYELLKELNKIKPVWVELGFQTCKEESVKYIRRGYENHVYSEAVKRLKAIGIHVITHVILYLPNETVNDMLDTIKYVVDAKSDGIKLSELYILKNTDLVKDIEKIYIPTLDEYINTLKECIALLPEDMVVHRLNGDPPKRLLIAPLWAADKKNVINSINEELFFKKPYYVYILECDDGTFYTGYSDDVLKRFDNHVNNKGAKYTKAHKAVKILYVREFKSKSKAMKHEYEVKRLSKDKKIKLLDDVENIASKFIL